MSRSVIDLNGKPSGIACPNIDGNVYSTGAVCRMLGVAPRTVSTWCDRGMMPGAYRLPKMRSNSPPGAKAGGRDRRIPAASIVAFCREHGLPVPAELGGAAAGEAELLLTCGVELMAGAAAAVMPSLFALGVAAARPGSPFRALIDCCMGRSEVLAIGPILKGMPLLLGMAVVLNEDETDAPAFAAVGYHAFTRPLDPRAVEAWLGRTPT